MLYAYFSIHLCLVMLVATLILNARVFSFTADMISWLSLNMTNVLLIIPSYTCNFHTDLSSIFCPCEATCLWSFYLSSRGDGGLRDCVTFHLALRGLVEELKQLSAGDEASLGSIKSRCFSLCPFCVWGKLFFSGADSGMMNVHFS